MPRASYGTSMSEGQRRLAAIMFTDIVGYTALTQSNEALAMELLEMHNRLLRPIFPRFHGREVKTVGDSFLVEFESALEALKCAVEIQSRLHDFNVSSGSEQKVNVRIGIHLGDVIHRAEDVFGDAVNIASRIQTLADSEGICVSRQVYDQVRNKFELPLLPLGEKSLKNVSLPVEVFMVRLPWERAAGERRDAVSYSRERIAILPFANFSPDPNDSYFADGITAEIIATVSGISGLSVISRTSVMGYKGTAKKIGEIGSELRVGSILEGSLRKSGNRIRVSAQLVDVATDRHLWTQNYDRELDDVFAVQSDVAKQVAEALRVRILSPELARIEKKPTENTEAYTFYLKGRHEWNNRGIEYNRKAAECFEQAVEEDPKFALGYVGLADCSLVLRNNWGLDRVANLERAKAMVAKALELDPGLAEAHATEGLILWEEYDLRLAEVEFRKAIELKPSYATAHQWYFTLLVAQLEWDRALEEIERAVELDPFSPIINLNHGFYYFFRGDYGRALEFYRRVAMLDPGRSAIDLSFAGAPSGIADVYGKLGMFDDMKREFAKFVNLLQDTYPLVKLRAEARMAYLQDDRGALRKVLPELEARLKETGSNAYSIACFYFYLGENDKGFQWLEKSYADREDTLLYIKWDWDLDPVRTDPRYLDLLKRLGLD